MHQSQAILCGGEAFPVVLSTLMHRNDLQYGHQTSLPPKFAKVVFSQVFVCPQGGVSVQGAGLCVGDVSVQWEISMVTKRLLNFDSILKFLKFSKMSEVQSLLPCM